MRSRFVFASVVAAVLAALMGSCSSESNPYDALSIEASRYVIPDSENWTSGELCPDGGDCSGPITPSVIENYDWLRITDLAVAPGESIKASLAATLSVEETRSVAGSGSGSVSVRVWGPDVDDVEEVLAEGFETWAGVGPENN